MFDTVREIDARLAEIRSLLDNDDADLDALQSEINELTEKRNAIVAKAEQRKTLMSKVSAGAGTTKEVQTPALSADEVRAKNFAETGRTKIESRQLLSTGKIAKPVAVGGINGLPAVASDIIDDVHIVSVSGNGTWRVAYKKTDAVAAEVTDGSEIGGTGAEFDYVDINPSQWGVLDEVSNQVALMTPLNYLSEVEASAITGLRAYGSDVIVKAIKASALVEKKTGVALDQDFLRTIVLGFRAIKTKGACKLYINQADLGVLGKVRGTNEKRSLYTIEFDNEEKTAGTISEGGFATAFRILDSLEAGTQFYGQPQTIDCPLWNDYVIETDEGGDYFKRNMIGVRGKQTANADVVAYHGMQVITQASE